MTQEELQSLKILLDKARTVLKLPGAKVSVFYDDDLNEFVLFGSDDQEGIYSRVISSEGVSSDYL